MMRSKSTKRIWRRKERGTAAPASERGTVLLMVIGVLAMLAILAIVYASIGQSDRRTSTAYVRSVQIQDISSQMGDYIADIIGRDVTETISEEVAGRQLEYRVTWTYPSVEYNDEVKSNPLIGGGRKFVPYGRGYQPWLAPLEPTFLRFNQGTAWTDQNRQYLDFRDWLTISNVAPNGQFVNLANLRNNFFAEPGIGLDDNNRPRMSEGLTLYGNNAAGLPQNSNNPILEDGRQADLNIPWHWTARQRHAARPIINFRTGAGQPGPAEDEFTQNQWADADGDGIADSRFFALDTSAGPFAEWINQGLAQQDRVRYFAAVRVVDTSGMTNINTAMDLLAEPVPRTPNTEPAAYPLGITASDTDMLRRLMNADAYQRYGVGYDAFRQPTNPQDAGRYNAYTNASGSPASQLVGRAAYANLQWSTSVDRVDPAQDADPRHLGTVLSLNNDTSRTRGVPFATEPAQRAVQYINSQLDPAHLGFSTSLFVYEVGNPGNPPAVGFRSRQPFGMAEELELHAFFSANDPRESSRLEAVLEGRRNRSGDGTVYPTFGPLRSTRDHQVERDRRGVTVANGQQDITSLAQQHLDIRHTITTYNASRPLTFLRPQNRFDADVVGDNEVRVNLTPFLYSRGLPPETLRTLFQHACDAIMPYRAVQASDNLWSRTQARNSALHYGGSAEFAFRSTAHWTMNIRDAADSDNALDRNGQADDKVRGPSVMTLQLVRGGTPPARTPEYPWDPLTILNPELELATSTADVQSARVNIFGIEAQPFLVEAASYAWWTDMPHNVTLLQGQTVPDNEWLNGDPDGPAGPLPREDTPITIDHDVEYANADFLGEVVAFQITNPFDRDLVLVRAGSGSTLATPEIFYYVEYANRFFPLAEIERDNTTMTFVNADLILRAGETRVFFASSPRREFEFNQRFGVTNTGMNRAGRDMSNFLRDWANRQFRRSDETAPRDAIHTSMFNPETFAFVDPEPSAAANDNAGLMDLHGDFADPPASSDDRRIVNLWRVMRHRLDDATGANMRSNDLLADRMRDPGGAGAATLYQRLDSQTNDEVPDTIAGDDSLPTMPPPDVEDNTGFTITMWGAIRRPTNPDTLADHSPRGAMPPWTLEARSDQIYSFSFSSTPHDPNNLNFQEDGPGDRGDGSDYRTSSDSRYIRIRDMYDDQAVGDGGTRLNTEIREVAEAKNGNPIPDSQYINDDGSAATFNERAVRIALGGRDRSGDLWNAGLFQRIGDVLRPLAIGPYSDPTNNDTMCLSEVLALATDYYSPPTTHLYHHAGHKDPSQDIRPKLDRGHFVIDDFVPFNDIDNNGTFNPSAGNKEQALGLGIPIALNLLDKFRLDNIAGKAKGESGKTNINTATLMSASVIPLLTPDPLSPWMTETVANEREPLYDPATHQSDRAAAVMSYRDKLDIRTRPLLNLSGSGEGEVAMPGGNTLEISFRDTTGSPEFTEPWLHDGRRNRNLIPNIREELGFRSPGEILAVLLRDGVAGNEQYRSNSMDWYGADEVAILGHRGIEPVNIPDYNNLIEDAEINDEVVDDYGEKIAIANAALGSITTRSDTFCVWFVLHGYQQSDVENLGPRDPMIPTLAKRYMMIVDRTNVVKKGDKPRILMFREVPM